MMNSIARTLITAVITLTSVSINAQNNWIQRGQMTYGGADGDGFGFDVAISDNGRVKIIGIPYRDQPGVSSGGAKVYEYVGSTWNQRGATITGDAPGDNAGLSVAVNRDGSMVAIGYNSASTGGFVNNGKVKVFEWNTSTGNWDQVGNEITGVANSDNFGRVVELSADGQTIAISTPSNDDAGSAAGHVRVFEYNQATSDWDQKGQTITGDAALDFAGMDIDLSSDGSRLIVGISASDLAGSNAGIARVYEYNNTTSAWDQLLGNLFPVTANPITGYGFEVSISGDGMVIAIGAPDGDPNADGNTEGLVDVYEYQPTGWANVGARFEGASPTQDQLGSDIDLDYDGNTITIGSSGHLGMGGFQDGRVQVFRWNGSSWNQIGQDINGEDQDELGEAVSIDSSGTLFAVGAEFGGSVGGSEGRAQVFGQCLLSQHPFDGNPNDTEALMLDAVLPGGAAYTSNRWGTANKAYNNAGTGSYAELNYPEYQFSGEWSVVFWVNRDNITMIPQDRYLIGAWSDYSVPGTNEWIIMASNPGGTDNDSLSFVVETSGNSFVEANSNVPVTPNEWHMVTGVYRTDSIFLYMNGVEVAKAEIPMGESMINKGVDVTIGGNVGEMTDASFDDLRFYLCALTPETIDSMYQSEAPPTPCQITVQSAIDDPICAGGNDGTIDLTTTGSGPFSWIWNTGATTEDLNGIQAGTYTVTISDDVGCDTTISFMVADPLAMDIEVTTSDASCGGFDGSASVSVIGGIAPYSYSWTNGDTLSSADTLSAGSYMVTVTDANGCQQSENFTISDQNGPSLSHTTVSPTCPGDDDGSIDLTVSGGTSPYTYDWDNGATTEDISNIEAGVHQVEVTDANGCVAMATIIVDDAPLIDLSNVTLTNPTCGNADGEIEVVAAGGTGNLSYQWGANAGNATTSVVSGLTAGAYYLTVTDDNGCTETQGYMLSNTSAPTVTLQGVVPVACNGSGGDVNISVTGANPPFTYDWSNGATTQDLTGVAVGTYDLNVTDAAGCVTMFTVDVTAVLPAMQPICIVTVDTTTQTNLVAWEKATPANGIAYYKIYREGNAAGVYNLMDTVHWNSISEWTDPVADPTQRGWRYKISAVDSCGTESPLSPVHKTVHLAQNIGIGGVINLSWDNYVGFTHPSWHIHRWNSTTGWEAIDTIPSNLFSYTDATPPAGNLYYSVEGEPAQGCTSTRANNHNTTRSNRIQPSAMTSIVETSTIKTMGVYPNPTNGQLTISGVLEGPSTVEIRLFDIEGRLIMSKTSASGIRMEETLNIGSVERGVYLLNVQIGEDIKVMRIVRE